MSTPAPINSFYKRSYKMKHCKKNSNEKYNNLRKKEETVKQ